jgi:hypothetical protein
VGESHIRTGPGVEHRYIRIHYPNETDAAKIEAAALEVYRHFVREVEERYPTAPWKMVYVLMHVDGREGQDLVIGEVGNYLHPLEKLPDHPPTRWYSYARAKCNVNYPVDLD